MLFCAQRNHFHSAAIFYLLFCCILFSGSTYTPFSLYGTLHKEKLVIITETFTENGKSFKNGTKKLRTKFGKK